MSPVLNRIALQSRKRKRDCKVTLADLSRRRGMEDLPLHLLFECATGYALFLANGGTQVDMTKFEAVEEYLNSSDQPFELKAYLPFSSDSDALHEMNAVSNSIASEKLKKFLSDYFPRPTYRYQLGIIDAIMGDQIVRKTGLGCRRAVLIDDIMRGLREKIDHFIRLQPGELEKAQINLARLYINQKRAETGTKSPVVVSSSSSSLKEQAEVVQHKFEGFFNVKGKENILCTRNLVPGEALYGEKLILVQNEDRSEVEYRIWDPLRSKLGAAIHCGVTNIWIKPGSRVLYMGNVCGLTVCNLSDLVGLDGLVYVLGLSDDVADMAGKRPNVLTTTGKCNGHFRHRMLVGMVDVILAEIDHHPEQQFSAEGAFVVNNAHFYLRAGGHYMICRKANNVNSSGGFIFYEHDGRMEFKQIETVMLDTTDGAYALDVGGYRVRKG